MEVKLLGTSGSESFYNVNGTSVDIHSLSANRLVLEIDQWDIQRVLNDGKKRMDEFFDSVPILRKIKG